MRLSPNLQKSPKLPNNNYYCYNDSPDVEQVGGTITSGTRAIG